MSWRDRLRPASFRGVPFHTSTRSATVGRRNVATEYPQRDTPFVEDMGRRMGEFRVDAYILASDVVNGVRGDDHTDKHLALKAALEAPGPGTLVHPVYGSMRVAVLGDAEITESTSEGGVTRFNITFVEAGENLYPNETENTAAIVDESADEALAVIEADFAENFTVENLPEFVSDGAIEILDDAIADIRSLSARIATATAPITELSTQIDTLSDSLATLIQTPANLANDLVGVVVAIAGVASDARAAFAGYKTMWPFGDDRDAVETPTATRSTQATNQAALHALVQSLATIEACRASADMEFESFDDANGVREQLVDQLDELMENASDTVYATLIDLRVAVVKDITARGADLARIVRYTPVTTLPALVISYKLYGDASRDEEIVARNRIKHPDFVIGGRAIQVLADG